MRRTRRYSGRSLDPRWITAKFSSDCRCGHLIRKGESVFYYPTSKTALCQSCGDEAARFFTAAAEDEANNGCL